MNRGTPKAHRKPSNNDRNLRSSRRISISSGAEAAATAATATATSYAAATPTATARKNKNHDHLPPTHNDHVNEEIIACLQELNIPVTHEILNEPSKHKEHVRAIFLVLVEYFCDLNMAALEEITLKRHEKVLEMDKAAAVACITPPQSVEMTFFKAVQSLMKLCNCSFSFRDLYTPQRDRLRNQLWAMIDLAKFRAREYPELAHLHESHAGIIVEMEKAEEKNLELMYSKAELEEKGPFIQSQIESLTQQYQALNTETLAFDKSQADNRKETIKLQKQISTILLQIETAQLNVNEAQNELQHVQNQLVHSPERKQRVVEQKRVLLQSIQNTRQELKLTCDQYKDNIRQRQALVQDLQGLHQVDTLIELAERSQKLSESIRLAEVEVSKLEKAKAVKDSENANAQREHDRSEEHYAGIKKRQDLELKSLDETIKMKKLQLIELEKDRQETMQRIELAERDVRALESQMEQEKQVANEKFRSMVAEYREIEQAFLEKHRLALEAMKLDT